MMMTMKNGLIKKPIKFLKQERSIIIKSSKARLYKIMDKTMPKAKFIIKLINTTANIIMLTIMANNILVRDNGNENKRIKKSLLEGKSKNLFSWCMYLFILIKFELIFFYSLKIYNYKFWNFLFLFCLFKEWIVDLYVLVML